MLLKRAYTRKALERMVAASRCEIHEDGIAFELHLAKSDCAHAGNAAIGGTPGAVRMSA